MAADTRTTSPPVAVTLWRATIGKKIVMAVTGVVMIGFLAAHMVGNLKVFSGAAKFNAYGEWLRTIGEPVLPYSGFLWLLRLVLLGSVVLHLVAAVQLTHRGVRHRPRRHTRPRLRQRNYVTFTMRSGGVVLALFIVWHILDLTTLTVNDRAQPHHPYENLVASFSTWYGAGFYLLAMLALGFHLWHGIASAAQTLGVHEPGRLRGFHRLAAATATIITGGFALVPLAVLTGVLR